MNDLPNLDVSKAKRLFTAVLQELKSSSVNAFEGWWLATAITGLCAVVNPYWLILTTGFFIGAVTKTLRIFTDLDLITDEERLSRKQEIVQSVAGIFANEDFDEHIKERLASSLMAELPDEDSAEQDRLPGDSTKKETEASLPPGGSENESDDN